MRTPRDRRELIVIGLLAFLAGVGLPIVSLVRSICGTCAATDWLDPDYIFAVTPVVAGMLAAVLLRGPDRRRVGLLHLAVAIGVVVEGILLVILRSDGPFLLMMAFPVGLPFLFASCLIATVAYFAASIASGYVSRRWVTAAVAASFIAVIGTLFAQSWWPRELPPRELHARVLDADTFEGIADAIVLAEYKAFGPMGSGGVSCHLGETTVSDKDGWFTLPLDPDPRSGMPILHAYHRGYMWVFSPRFPLCERFDRCRIGVGKWDTNRHMVSYYSESEIFPNHEAAEKASRYWIDPYLKRVDMVPSERLEELHSEGNSRNVHVFRHLYSRSALVS